MSKRRKRNDARISTIEKELGVPGAFRHKSGRDIRGDMKLRTLRKKKGSKN